ncbi:MAG TPA: RdgB/HAM1 family non-canonical purine NTP pyrophosphatase [Pyrinomonadaceae bacterium]|jgi:XTP/dITP diphosphohydrolase
MNSPLKSLLIGTWNPGKIVEVKSMLEGLPFELTSLAEFPSLSAIDETGQTFAENAALKAQGYALQTGLWTISDDSGLEVEALDEAPGVLSARFAGAEASDAERVSLLLSKLSLIPDRRRVARFVCATAVSDADGRLIYSATGICDGRLSFHPRGSGGFGYDPVFVPDGYNLTLAELGLEVKNQISHRARALAATRDFLLALHERILTSS